MAQQKENGSRLKREIIDYIGIFIGVNITALGLVWFLIPNKIAAGGVSGLATILYYLWQWPVGVVILLVNIPLFLACLLVFGPNFGMKTVFGTVLLSVVIEYWGAFLHPLTLDPLLGSLWGGVLAGAGVGIALRYHGTTGGTDLAAKLLARFSSLSMGQAVLVLDGLVIALAGLVFKSVDLMLYALISIVVSGKIIDGVLDGFNYSKGVYIISDQSERIAQRILNEMDRGVRVWRGAASIRGKPARFCS